MTTKLRTAVAVALSLAATASITGSASGQVRNDGALVQHNAFGRAVVGDEVKVEHGSEFKGAHKVAISVFDVAFPDQNHFTANIHGNMFHGAASSSMSTSLHGIDRATQQRIADKAYALFVAQLTAAGYEVVDQAELTRLAPEFGRWDTLPNFTEGRFGAYVAPTGQALRFLQGDAAKRDTSGMFGVPMTSFRALDRPQAFTRSPYIAHDGKLGIIAVTLVVDYGVYSSSGEAGHHGKAETGFRLGVTMAAGDIVDHGSLVEYWGQNSGGFPAYALLEKPVRSERAFATMENVGGGEANGQSTVTADPTRFEAAADDVLAEAVPKLVAAMAAAR